MAGIGQILQDNSTLGIIMTVAASTATIVWKVAQYANKIMSTVQQQSYTLDRHTDEIKEGKQAVSELSRMQSIHHTRLVKLESK